MDRPLEKIEERHESESEAEDVKPEEVVELEKIEENQEEEQQSVQSVEAKTEDVKGERGCHAQRVFSNLIFSSKDFGFYWPRN